MAYKMKLEFTGLKLEIEHDDDGTIPPAVDALQRQLAGVIQTVNALAAGSQNGAAQPANQIAMNAPKAIEPAPFAGKGNTRAKGNGRRGGSGVRGKAEPLELKHDAEKFGQPKQDWNTATKAMWLLYMLSQQTEHKEASAPV